MSTATVHIDGGSRGNPGPASYAFVLRRPGLPDYEESDTLGRTTNNVAEYTALIRALERAAEFGVTHLDVFGDSELIVKQVKGEYRVKNADLQDLYAEAKAALKPFAKVTLTHVRREQNADADRLCNEALDGHPKRYSGPETPAATGSAPPRPSASTLRLDAIAILESAAETWAANGTKAMSADDVWNSLVQILKKHDALK